MNKNYPPQLKKFAFKRQTTVIEENFEEEDDEQNPLSAKRKSDSDDLDNMENSSSLEKSSVSTSSL